ncbi:MAG TPA: bifunctional diguanylate cyclase/phosphodiesterase [Sphingomonas sp.]|uniref:putative bifunctional diguanylate cyclase/phosphodiesterase n=1 Tax=Sphingomonas sp. TaxID=28214 RepID=UPI002BEAB94D|nr:bifunctional diguanylate cyclase/phosphodiesterase [Sphingomonas sp.]HMI18612.1 bifunctional diguanylate cyclase/phosphodiesterase [Sphingomonas sp.]
MSGQVIKQRARWHPVLNRLNLITALALCVAFVAWLQIRTYGPFGSHVLNFLIAIGATSSVSAIAFVIVSLRDHGAPASVPVRVDAVTGLMTPDSFMPMLDQKLREPARGAVSVMLVNLDSFRAINDVHGRNGGDTVLHLVAQRIAETAGPRAFITRLSGDEFALVIEHEPDGSEPRRLARLISDVVAAPLTVGRHTIQLRAAIGMATCVRCGLDAHRLVQTASIALGEAKLDRRNPVRAFRPTMEADLQKKSKLVAELRLAIEAGQIIPYYQPVVELATGALLGFECLARWLHPERGLIEPDVFIPLAEEHDLIDAITFGILHQACADMADWRPLLTLALNIAPQQLRDPKLAGKLRSAMVGSGVDPKRLVIEITESSLIADMDAARTTIAAFKRAGFVVALDDFGTGYASLRHLRELRFERIKIDRSFVRDIATSDSAQIIRAILSIGRGLGLPVIAEGIETTDQLHALLQFGCTGGQGYLYGQPMSAHDALGIIAKPERDLLLNALGMRQAA